MTMTFARACEISQGICRQLHAPGNLEGRVRRREAGVALVPVGGRSSRGRRVGGDPFVRSQRAADPGEPGAVPVPRRADACPSDTSAAAGAGGSDGRSVGQPVHQRVVREQSGRAGARRIDGRHRRHGRARVRGRRRSRVERDRSTRRPRWSLEPTAACCSSTTRTTASADRSDGHDHEGGWHLWRQGYSGDDGPAIDAKMSRPLGLALDPSGGFYFSDNDFGLVRHVDAAGQMSTIAGAGNVSPFDIRPDGVQASSSIWVARPTCCWTRRATCT